MAVEWKKLAYEADVITKALLTAAGDIIYASAAATPAVLPKANNGDVLTLAAGIPSWAAPGAPGAHAASHKSGGGDSIRLDEFAVPTAAVAFNGQQAQNFVLHTVANSGARPTAVVGKAIFQTDELACYVCTSDT